jgi:hypothetical protein
MYSNKKIIFIIKPFSDGSGDYSISYKLIKLFRKMGIDNKNILTIIPQDPLLFNYFATLNKEFNKNCKTDIYKGDTINDQLLNNKNISEFNEILLTICKQFKILYNMSDYQSFCNTGKFDDISVDTSTSSVIGGAMRKVIISNPNTVLLDNEVFTQKIHYLSDSTISAEQLDFRKKISDIITSINEDATCTISKDLLKTFNENIINNPNFYIGFYNIIKFFLSSDINDTNFKYYELSRLGNITPSELEIENNLCDTIIISFLWHDLLWNKKIYLLPRINLSEGGLIDPINKIYAPGYMKDSIYALGINFLDYTTIKDISIESPYYNERLSMVLKVNMIYNICYFGYNIYMSFWNNFLILYKLKYFIEKVTECQDICNIYINENVFIIINTHFDEITAKILPDIQKIENGYTLIVNGKTVYIRYYKPMANDQFINFINKSQDLCMLSGDQSYFEGISLGKLIIYDILPHKFELYRQMLKMYRDYSNDLTLDEVIDEMIDKLNISPINSYDKYHLKNEPIVLFENNKITLTQSDNIDGNEYIKKNIFTFDILKVNFECNDFIKNEDGTLQNELLRIDPIIVEYCNIKNIYDFNYKINKLIINNKDKFRCFLNEKYNLDKNLMNVIKQHFFTKLDTFKNKYLKYKNKYIKLKKMIN